MQNGFSLGQNLQSTGQPFGSRVSGFRQDDRARSRATVAPPVYRGRGKAVLKGGDDFQ